MGVLARASAEEIAERLAKLPAPPNHVRLRGPETGLVMVRGRAGGDGAPFNLGEVTATRASVRLEGGAVGHGQALGTDGEKARLALAESVRRVTSIAMVHEALSISVDERVDRLYEESGKETDPAKRAAMFREIQERYVAQAPILFLYETPYPVAFRRNAHGFVQIPLGNNWFEAAYVER